MAAVTYRPGPHDPAAVEWGGITFQANMPVEVTNERMLRKALGNPFFDTEDEIAPAAPPPEPDDKAALVAEAEALGIDVDKRWGAARLIAEISKAKANGDDPQQA